MIEQRLLAFTLLGAGWVLWLLVGLSVLSVAVMLERGLYFGQRRMSKRFPELLRLCEDGSLDKAAQLAQGDAMEAEVVRAAARVASSGQAAVEKAVASTIDRRRLEYERWLFWGTTRLSSASSARCSASSAPSPTWRPIPAARRRAPPR